MIQPRFEKIESLVLDRTPLINVNRKGAPVRITGPRGTDLSKVLETIAGLSGEGEYLVNGRDIAQLPPAERRAFHLSVGYAFDQGGLLANQSLLENATLPLHYHGFLPLDKAEEKALSLFGQLGILDSKNQRPALATAAARKSCSLARALILDPQVLILNHPTDGLCEETETALLALLWERRRSGGLKHIFLVTEDVDFASELGCETLRWEAA